MGRTHGAWRVRVVARRPGWRRMGVHFTGRMATDFIPMSERTCRALPGRRTALWPGSRWVARRRLQPHSAISISSRTWADPAEAAAAGVALSIPKPAAQSIADPAAFNKNVKALFLGIGSAEGPATENFSGALTKAGIHNVYFESPGTAHEWLPWGRCLNDFAPRRSVGGTATDYLYRWEELTGI